MTIGRKMSQSFTEATTGPWHQLKGSRFAQSGPDGTGAAVSGQTVASSYFYYRARIWQTLRAVESKVASSCDSEWVRVVVRRAGLP